MKKSIGVLLLLLGLAGGAEASVIGYTVQSNGNDHLYRIDLTTGLATDLGLVSFDDAEGLATVGSTLYAIGGSTPEFWDLTTVPGALVGATGARDGLDAGLSYNPATGVMYNLQGGYSGSSLYTVNLATGAATLVGSDTGYGDGLAINASGAAYASDAGFANGLYSVNLLTGGMTFVGGFGLGSLSEQAGLSFDSTGALWMLLSSGRIYNVNTVTGAANYVANVNLGGHNLSDFEGLAVPAAPVPEPASLMLFGFALSGAGLRRWRRR